MSYHAEIQKSLDFLKDAAGVLHEIESACSVLGLYQVSDKLARVGKCIYANVNDISESINKKSKEDFNNAHSSSLNMVKAALAGAKLKEREIEKQRASTGDNDGKT